MIHPSQGYLQIAQGWYIYVIFVIVPILLIWVIAALVLPYTKRENRHGNRAQNEQNKRYLYICVFIQAIILFCLCPEIWPWWFNASLHWTSWVWYAAICVFFWARNFLDINSTSLHGFYRDRLVETYFYGKVGELCADDEITKSEGEYAVLIEGLRNKEDRVDVSDIKIGKFIVHLLFRTKLLRKFAHNSAEYLLDELAKHFSDFENMKKLILKRPDLIKDRLKKELKKYRIPKGQNAVEIARAYKYKVP